MDNYLRNVRTLAKCQRRYDDMTDAAYEDDFYYPEDDNEMEEE